MNKIRIVILIIVVLSGCKKEPINNTNPVIPPARKWSVSVLTQHNDNTRAGLNAHEKILTTANVKTSKFGKLFTLPVDDQVYAQPLVFSNLVIGSDTSNVAFIATVNNSIYAFNADNGNMIWHRNYTEAGMRPQNAGDITNYIGVQYTNITNNFGIIGTPVIDSISKTIYFVTRSTDGSKYYQDLHAVNIVNGDERQASPALIKASVTGSGDGSVNNVVSFDPFLNNQRQGLALVKGVVYITYSSYADAGPYHGWVLGYDAQSMALLYVYNDTPDGGNGGLWESGMGIAADAQGNLYLTSGNGTVGTPGSDQNSPSPDPTNLRNRGESALKLTPSGATLAVTSYFTPSNYVDLNINDNDYGGMGTLLIPNSEYYVTGCKDGNLYILNKDNMGGYSPSSNQVQQTLVVNGSVHCQPAYYKGSQNEFVYVWSEDDQLRAFPFNRGSNTFGSPVLSNATGPSRESGAELSVSSNGTIDSTAVLWASYALTPNSADVPGPGILKAFNANDVTKELWNSEQNSSDNSGNFAKFSPPTIVNGHVYLATFSNQVVVYGLK
jgi:PQQ enzyme repeat